MADLQGEKATGEAPDVVMTEIKTATSAMNATKTETETETETEAGALAANDKSDPA
jgi:hypothetical protein